MGRFQLIPTDPTGDEFNLEPRDIAESIPQDQQTIQQEVYEAINILKFLKTCKAFEPDQANYTEFVKRILQAAKNGCVIEHVQTGGAKRGLEDIRADIMRRYGRPMYYRYLVAYAAWSAVALIIGAALIVAATRIEGLAPGYGWAVIGSMVGAWLSVAFLRSKLSFLGIQDFLDRRYEPFVRVLLVSATTIVLGLFLQFGIFSVKIGPVDLAMFDSKIGVALIFGVISGFFGEGMLAPVLVQRLASYLPK